MAREERRGPPVTSRFLSGSAMVARAEGRRGRPGAGRGSCGGSQPGGGAEKASPSSQAPATRTAAVPSSSPHYHAARKALADLYLSHRNDKVQYAACHEEVAAARAAKETAALLAPLVRSGPPFGSPPPMEQLPPASCSAVAGRCAVPTPPW